MKAQIKLRQCNWDKRLRVSAKAPIVSLSGALAEAPAAPANVVSLVPGPRSLVDGVVLLQLHRTHARAAMTAIKARGEYVLMTQDAKRVDFGGRNGFQTVIWHGMTRSPSTKTTVQTLPGGSIKQWEENLS